MPAGKHFHHWEPLKGNFGILNTPDGGSYKGLVVTEVCKCKTYRLTEYKEEV